MKEERFPHTRKPLRRRRLRVEEGVSFGATEESAATGVRRAKRRDSLHRGLVPTSTHQPERLVCSPPGRVGAGRSDPRERTRVGCMNTA